MWRPFNSSLSHLQPRANWGLRDGWFELGLMWSSHRWWFSWSYFPLFPCHSGLKLDQLWMPWKRTSIYKNIIISTNPIYFISIYHHHLFQPTPYQSIQTPRNNKKEKIKREWTQIKIIKIQYQNKFSSL